jgi:hypothetical protein
MGRTFGGNRYFQVGVFRVKDYGMSRELLDKHTEDRDEEIEEKKKSMPGYKFRRVKLSDSTSVALFAIKE